MLIEVVLLLRRTRLRTRTCCFLIFLTLTRTGYPPLILTWTVSSSLWAVTRRWMPTSWNETSLSVSLMIPGSLVL